jgi:hypothetical protein
VSATVKALRITVGKKTARVCAGAYSHTLRAVVLTGSLARDEATWKQEATGWRLLGDAEFLLVFEPSAALPAQISVDSLAQKIQDSLRCDGIIGCVQLVPVHPRYLKKLQPHIFAYELRNCGQVVWGDCSITSLIPTFSAGDIPLEDAWRLLANRMIELLEAVARAEVGDGNVPEELQYRTLKLYLDMATSLLLFSGSYAQTYRERERRLRILAAVRTNENWPFPMGPFARQVFVSTELKLGHELRDSPAAGWDFWFQSIRYAQLLWRWELSRLVNEDRTATRRELMRNWMHRQCFTQRLRGWMFVWRACGWLQGWRWWLRWIHLALGGSPRHWVYSAAHSLFCQLPDVLEQKGRLDISPASTGELLACLPVPRRSEAGSWTELVHEVAWNYHCFLKPTQA